MLHVALLLGMRSVQLHEGMCSASCFTRSLTQYMFMLSLFKLILFL